VVDEVGSSDLVLSDTSSTVVTACAADSPVGAMSAFSLAVSGSTCVLSFTEAHADSAGLSEALLTLEAAGLSTSLPFWIYVPANLALRADDLVLNRIDDMSGTPIAACGASPYQRTQLHLSIESSGSRLDATELVRFDLNDSRGLPIHIKNSCPHPPLILSAFLLAQWRQYMGALTWAGVMLGMSFREGQPAL
jgi:hypothetical protein